MNFCYQSVSSQRTLTHDSQWRIYVLIFLLCSLLYTKHHDNKLNLRKILNSFLYILYYKLWTNFWLGWAAQYESQYKWAKIRSRIIGLTKCHAWLFHIWVHVCGNNNLLLSKNKLLSSKQNACENIGTLSESAIAIFSDTCDGLNIRQRTVRDRAWAHHHHPRRALRAYWQLDGAPPPSSIDDCHYFSLSKATYASEKRCCVASTL